MQYEGNLEDLMTVGEYITNPFYCIYFNGQPVSLNNKILFTTFNYAKANLRKHIFYNFCQGHYWHKGKDNTFAKEKGWERNNGKVASSKQEFQKFAKSLTDTLLNNKTFEIKSVIL